TSQETLEGGMLRLIRALFEGANYNSAGSLRSRETANEGEVVTDADFFMMMREKPQDAIEKLLESSPQLEKAGWAIGSRGLELLRKGKGDSKVAKEALMAVFVGTGQDGIISLSDHLNATDRYERWKDVGGVLAEYLFNKKMLSLDIEKQLEDLSSGRQDPKSGTYFGT
ncbi:hypothetical protein KKH50_00575, partial [Patescibacteria group bacterium]|nr:hypothetical protein [Patescibacteria group bacterium]